MDTEQVIERHRDAGRFFEVGDVTSFAREEGTGSPVVCIHGVPTSSFLYRNVIEALDREGMRGIAFDLPGLGLADRPEDFDYTWTGLGEFSVRALESLDLEEFHLVVHDIGGPVGFEVAARKPEAIQSLTVLNAMIRVDEFTPPWFMRLFQLPVLGELWLKAMTKRGWRTLFRRGGIEDPDAVTNAEMDAYLDLLERGDGGSAFLEIMRGFEQTPEKRERYVSTLRDAEYPMQVIWGTEDPAVEIEMHGEAAREITGVEAITEVASGHFLQEEHPETIAREIRDLAEERPVSTPN